MLLRNRSFGTVELKWWSNLRLLQNGGAVLPRKLQRWEPVGFFFPIPTAADVQHFWKQLLAGSLSGGRQFIISPAVDSGSDAVGGRGYGRGCTAGLLKAKEKWENGHRQEGICALLTWKWL